MWTLRVFEEFCRELCCRLFESLWIKTYSLKSCIYGTNQFGMEAQGWVSWLIIASLLKKQIYVYGDGNQAICCMSMIYAKLYEKVLKKV